MTKFDIDSFFGVKKHIAVEFQVKFDFPVPSKQKSTALLKQRIAIILPEAQNYSQLYRLRLITYHYLGA
jgi:hypothetical protein